MSTSPFHHITPTDEHRHKRPRTVRRNTRSCSECKRRKVRCQLSSDSNATVCSSCVQRGISCVVQESHWDNESPPDATLEARLDRVEGLLERLVEKSGGASRDHDDHQGSNKQENALTHDHDGHQGSDKQESALTNGSDVQSAPVLSLFDNELFGRREMPDKYLGGYGASGYMARSSDSLSPKAEKLRQTLSALLPSQQDSDLIAESTNGWVLLSVHFTLDHGLYKNHDPTSSFNLAAVAKRSPTIIACTLLYLAICIQQLPPDFDISQFQMRITSVDALMDRYTAAVATSITSDDEFVGTIEGLECLVLQVLFHVNSGNLRRAWLSCRRGLTIAQLLGLEREYLRPSVEPESTARAKRMMWHKIIRADRYLSVMLGFPCGNGDDCFGDEQSLHIVEADSQSMFERRLCIITGTISARNLKGSSAQMYALTQDIDVQMNRLSNEMHPSWWEIPSIPAKGRSVRVVAIFDQLLAQIWFFQLKGLLHLPFMLRADTDQRYGYSKVSCLSASREVIRRYLALRSYGSSRLMCRIVDFAALVASLTLILDDLGRHSTEDESPKIKQRRGDDRSLIQEVVKSMEAISHNKKELVAYQSAEVIKALLRPKTTSRNLRLTIPYFGTISLLREQHAREPSPNPEYPTPSSFHTQQAESTVDDIESHRWQGSMNGSDPASTPVFSFESSHFPAFDMNAAMESYNFNNADQVFFNSMLETDVGSEWVL